MPRFDLLRRPQPLVGIFLAIGGWALSHQIGSESVLDDCTTRGGGFVILVSILGLIMAAAGGIYCLHSWRPSERSGRSFLALTGMLLAVMTSFAILLQLAAGMILPSCAA
jgi:hypothetical protein